MCWYSNWSPAVAVVVAAVVVYLQYVNSGLRLSGQCPERLLGSIDQSVEIQAFFQDLKWRNILWVCRTSIGIFSWFLEFEAVNFFPLQLKRFTCN